MSNFLSNLIDRSLAAEAQVTPRPLSLFEPAGERAGLEQMEEIEQVTTAPARSPMPHQETTPRIAPLPAPTPLSQEPAAHAAPPDTREQPHVSSPHSHERILEPGVLRVEPLRPAPAQIERPAPVQGESSSVASPAQRMIVEHTTIHERVVSTPLREQEPPEQPRALPVEPARATPQVAPPSQPQVEPQSPVSLLLAYEQAQPPLAIQPRIEPPPLRALPSSQRPDPEPAPVIQVTIGRIEVRASPAPTQPRRERAAPAVMSLDEYLRQRSQGGGR